MQRRCTYLNPEKRRGIRTGYLRAIEVALALLLECVPACENVLLVALAGQEEEGYRDCFLDKDSPAAEALLKRWHQSQAYQNIDRLISKDGGTPRSDPPAGGDRVDNIAGFVPRSIDRGLPAGIRAEANGELDRWLATSPDLLQNRAALASLELPPNFRHYLDVYHNYSHSWFPILEEEVLAQVMASYSPMALLPDPRSHGYGAHSELWSALAVGAALDSRQQSLFSDRQLGSPFDVGRPSDTASWKTHTHIYSTARHLIPPEDGRLVEPHVRSLLLLSLVKLTHDELNAAWLLVGQAVRLFLHLQLPRQCSREEATFAKQDLIVFMACFILDTLVSLRLEKPSHLRPEDLPNTLHPSHPQFRLFSAAQEPLGTISSPSPLAVLFQQYKFSRILNHHLYSRTGETSTLPGSRPADLIRSLDPPFHFCNALVHADLTPKAPAASLVHAAFLAASVLISPISMPRLIESLIDVASHCVSGAGAHGSPILLTLYLELAIGNHRIECLKADEQIRMLEILNILKGRHESSRYTHSVEGPSMTPRSAMEGLTPDQAASGPMFAGDSPGMPEYIRAGDFSDTRAPYNNNPVAPGAIQSRADTSSDAAVRLDPLLGGDLNNDDQGMVNLGRLGACSVDYDAILDELSSLDYVDNIEPDPQFLANLGFAPGCEPNEMFNGNFGSF